MNGKNAFERVTAVEDKSANLHIFVALMWCAYSQRLAVFLSFRIYAGIARGVGGGGGDNVRQILD